MSATEQHPKLRMTPSSPARTRAEQIADAIAKDITQGRLKPNQKLSEAELAAHFQVSRGPVRDALDLLERNMLVTIKPRSYTIVNQLTVRELGQVFEFRKHVLGLAAKFAARNHTEDDLGQLMTGLKKLTGELGSKKGSLSRQAFPASQMWDTIIDASHSPVVRQACLHFTGGNIWSRAVEQKISRAKIPAYQEKRIKLWREIVDSIGEADETTALGAGEAIVENNWQFLSDTFRHYFPE